MEKIPLEMKPVSLQNKASEWQTGNLHLKKNGEDMNERTETYLIYAVKNLF